MEKLEDLIKAGWFYDIEHVGRDGKIISVERVTNLMPTASLNYLLSAAYKSASQYTTLYLGLYDNNRTPLAADTMAEVLAEYGENVAYTGTQRETIVLPTVANGATNTIAAPNEFDFASSQGVRGAFISTSPTWGGGTGLLVSAVLFSSPKVIDIGETLRVPCGFAVVSA